MMTRGRCSNCMQATAQRKLFITLVQMVREIEGTLRSSSFFYREAWSTGLFYDG